MKHLYRGGSSNRTSSYCCNLACILAADLADLADIANSITEVIFVISLKLRKLKFLVDVVLQLQISS